MNTISSKVALVSGFNLLQFLTPEIGPVHIQFVLFGGIFIAMWCASLVGGQIFGFLGAGQ